MNDCLEPQCLICINSHIDYLFNDNYYQDGHYTSNQSVINEYLSVTSDIAQGNTLADELSKWQDNGSIYLVDYKGGRDV